MVDTAEDFISEGMAIENFGSHGDLPPMIDEGRRAEDKQEEAKKQSSEPKPISRKELRLRWADLDEEEEELHSLRL